MAVDDDGVGVGRAVVRAAPGAIIYTDSRQYEHGHLY